jgi:hypothetical protein
MEGKWRRVVRGRNGKRMRGRNGKRMRGRNGKRMRGRNGKRRTGRTWEQRGDRGDSSDTKGSTTSFCLLNFSSMSILWLREIFNSNGAFSLINYKIVLLKRTSKRRGDGGGGGGIKFFKNNMWLMGIT